MGEAEPVCAMYNVQEPYMYNLFEEPIIQNLAEIAPVFTTIVD